MDATGKFLIAIPACKFEIQLNRNFHNTIPITNSKLPYAACLVGLLLRPMRDHANDLLYMVGKNQIPCKFEIQPNRNFYNTLPITNSNLPYAACLAGLLLRPMRDHANDLLHMVGKNPDTLVLPTLAALCSEFCHKTQ